MFTEEKRSWRLPDQLIWVRLFFICFLDFCSETRTAAADGSVKQTLSGCCSRHGPGGTPPLPPLHPASGLLGGRPLEVPDLFDQVCLFVIELFILRSVVLELAKKLDEFGLVLQQDVQDGLRLVGVGHKYLVVEEEDKIVNLLRYCVPFLILITSLIQL